MAASVSNSATRQPTQYSQQSQYPMQVPGYNPNMAASQQSQVTNLHMQGSQSYGLSNSYSLDMPPDEGVLPQVREVRMGPKPKTFKLG
jgi:hypothetical protein